MNIIRKGLLLGIVAGASCWAAAVPVANNSFESPAQAPGGFTFGVATGWTVTGYGGVWAPQVGANNGSNFFAAVPGGNQVLFEGFTAPADATQDLGVSLLPDTVYTLTYFVGRRFDVPLSVYTVALKLGGTTLASDSGGAPAAGDFVQRTITFTTGAAPGAGTISIDISATGFSSTGGGGQADFDLVALDASAIGSVPEPVSMGLFGIGLLGVSVIGRKLARKK